MGVYIKDMEMPENCFDCPFMYGRKYCLSNSKIEFNDPEYSELKRRYDGCPLVPVPEPHGRLIDADVPISLVDTRGEKVEVTVAHIIEKNRGIVKAIIPASLEAE